MIMKKKKALKFVALVLLGLGFVFMVIGIVFNIKSKKDSSSPNVEEYPQELLDSLVTNSSPHLKEKHCLDDFCVTRMEINYREDSSGTILTVIKNERDTVIPAGFVNMNFYSDDTVVTLALYHLKLKPGEQARIVTGFIGSEVAYATDYQLSLPTEEQLQEYEQGLVR